MRKLNLQLNQITQNAPSFFQKGAQTLQQWMSYTVKNMQVGVFEIKNHPSMRTIVAANALFFAILYSVSNYLERKLIDQDSNSKLDKVFTKILFNGVLVGGLTSAFNTFLSRSLKQPLSESSLFVITTTIIGLRIILNKIFKSESQTHFSSEDSLSNSPRLNDHSSNSPAKVPLVPQTDEVQQKQKMFEDNQKKKMDAINKQTEIDLANIQKKFDAAKQLNQEKLDQLKLAKKKVEEEFQQKQAAAAKLAKENDEKWKKEEFQQKQAVADKINKKNAEKWKKEEAALNAKLDADLAALDELHKANLEKFKPKPAPQIDLGNFMVGMKFNVIDATTFNVLEIYENQGKVNALLISFLFGQPLKKFIPEEEVNWLSSKPIHESQLKNPQHWFLDGNKVVYNEPNPKAVEAEQLGMKHAAEGLFLLKEMGLDSNIDEEQLKKQIKKFLLKNHPDKNPNANQDLVKEVNGLLYIINHGCYKHYQLGLGKK